MAEITAAMVKDLREKTGAGMMDCKTALTEAAGDSEAAVDWLRKKGLAKAAKKAGRTAAEGLIGLVARGTGGVAVEVNAETDFVARNTEFQEMVQAVTDLALAQPADVAALRAAPYPGGGTVEERIAATIAKIGENMSLRRVAKLEVSAGAIGAYVHGAVVPGLGKIGVLVALESTGDKAALEGLGKQIAMHVAAANPVALTGDAIDPAVLEREKGVLADKARASGKPENVVAKIVESGLKSYFKEAALLDQAFVHDPSKSVAQAVKEAEGKAGAPIKVTGFVRLQLGEGIEKDESDFAAEVAAAAGKA